MVGLWGGCSRSIDSGDLFSFIGAFLLVIYFWWERNTVVWWFVNGKL